MYRSWIVCKYYFRLPEIPSEPDTHIPVLICTRNIDVRCATWHTSIDKVVGNNFCRQVNLRISDLYMTTSRAQKYRIPSFWSVSFRLRSQPKLLGAPHLLISQTSDENGATDDPFECTTFHICRRTLEPIPFRMRWSLRGGDLDPCGY